MNDSLFSLTQLKGRGDAENLQERLLQAAASGQEGPSGQPRGALHGPAAAARSLRGNQLHLTNQRLDAHPLTKKKKPNTLFIAPILNRHMLRQHSPQTGIKKASFTSCAFKIHLFFYHLHHKTWIVKFYENLNPRRRYWIVIIGPKLLLACQPPTRNKTKAHSMSEHSKSLLSQRGGTERWDKVFTVHFNILFPIKQPASLLICSLPCAILCWQWWMKTQRLACVHCCTCVYSSVACRVMKIKIFFITDLDFLLARAGCTNIAHRLPLPPQP